MNNEILQCPYCPNQKEANKHCCQGCYDDLMKGSECISVRNHLKDCSVCKSMFKSIKEDSVEKKQQEHVLEEKRTYGLS